MKRKPMRVGDRVRVAALGPIHQFEGEITHASYNSVGGGVFWVRDQDGAEWLRHSDEMTHIAADKLAPKGGRK